jgi:hypothetical protein
VVNPPKLEAYRWIYHSGLTSGGYIGAYTNVPSGYVKIAIENGHL